MKFLVTGGAGFIGHNVVRQLEQAGHECCVLDCVTDYGFVPQDELAYLYRERVKRIQAHIYHVDLRNASGVANWFAHYSQGADAVIHLASFPRQNEAIPSQEEPTTRSSRTFSTRRTLSISTLCCNKENLKFFRFR